MSTISTIRENYSYVPNDLLDLLEAAINYYELENTGTTVSINVSYGSGGATNSQGMPHFSITIPNGSGGLVSVNNAYSENGSKNTFLAYDTEAALIHELGHVIQSLIGGSESTELNNAMLKIAVDSAKQITGENILSNFLIFISAFKNILGITEGNDDIFNYNDGDYDNDLIWSTSDKLEIARSSTASSYENYYNTQIRNYAAVSGLSNVNYLYRTGYLSHENVGADDEWTTYSSTADSTIIQGSYKNLISRNQSVDLLGNQYDNTLATGNGSDYLDGGKGSDTLIGNGGNDYLEGGAGLDILVGGVDYDTYVANNSDIIFDEDGLGGVYLFTNNPRSKLTGGVQLQTDGNTYEGTTASGHKVLYTIEEDNLIVTSQGESFMDGWIMNECKREVA